MHFSGHGRGKKTSCFSFPGLLAEAIAAESWLRHRGYARIAVCGHSQGGILALAHATQSEHLIAAFPVCAIFPQAAEAIELTKFRRLPGSRKIITGITRALARIMPWLPVPLPAYLSLRRIARGRKRPVLIGSGRGRSSYPVAYLDSLFSAVIPHECLCPVYPISAKNDALFTCQLMRSTFERMRAPHKEMIWLDDGGHLAPFNPWLGQFIAREIACRCSARHMRLETGMEEAWHTGD